MYVIVLTCVIVSAILISEYIENHTKPIEMTGYLFLLNTNEVAYLTHLYDKVKLSDKIIYEDQIKKIVKLDNIVPKDKSTISLEDARTSAEKELKGEAFFDWFERLFGSSNGLHLGEGVLVYDMGDTVEISYYFPIFKNDNIMALIVIDADDGDVMSYSRILSWINKEEAIEMFVKISKFDRESIKRVYCVQYEIEDPDAARNILGVGG